MGDVIERLHAEAVELVIHDMHAQWARVAADFLGLPRIMSNPESFPRSPMHRPLGRPLAARRRVRLLRPPKTQRDSRRAGWRSRGAGDASSATGGDPDLQRTRDGQLHGGCTDGHQRAPSRLALRRTAHGSRAPHDPDTRPRRPDRIDRPDRSSTSHWGPTSTGASSRSGPPSRRSSTRRSMWSSPPAGASSARMTLRRFLRT